MRFLEGLKIRSRFLGGCHTGNGVAIQTRANLAPEREGKGIKGKGVEQGSGEASGLYTRGSRSRGQAAFWGKGKIEHCLQSQTTELPFPMLLINKEGVQYLGCKTSFFYPIICRWMQEMLPYFVVNKILC